MCPRPSGKVLIHSILNSPSSGFLIHSLLQCSNGLFNDLFTNTERLDFRFLDVLERPYAAYMRVRRVSGSELACSNGGEAAFGVVPGSRILASASCEDCGFAGLESSCRDVEDQLEESWRCHLGHLCLLSFC